MSKTTYVHTRIDPLLKDQAELVFQTLGISLTEAITLFFKQVTLRDGLPFELAIPPKNILYHAEKQALLAHQAETLKKDILLGQEAVNQGEVITSTEARQRSQARLKQWQDKEADS